MKTNLKDALIALDMVHADLHSRLEILKEKDQKAMVINEMELRSLLLLVSNAMIDCGDVRLKRKDD